MKEGAARSPYDAWEDRLLVSLAGIGLHPGRLLREGWTPGELNRLAAARELIQEKKAESIE